MTNSEADGTVILDTNALKVLEPTDTLERVRSSLRVVGLTLWPSALNLVEAVSMQNVRVRNRILTTIAAIADGRPLLPLVSHLLARTGAAILAGDAGFHTESSGLEWAAYEPERITSEHVLGARKLLHEYQRPWEAAHERARREIRRLLQSKRHRDPWGSIPAFLDQQWMSRDHIESYVELLWERFGLPGRPPVEQVLATEVWRAYFEGLGATVYERCVLDQLPKRAHVIDVMQLAYLAGSPARILVTEDAAAVRIAEAVLYRRYPMSRVLTPAQFLDKAA